MQYSLAKNNYNVNMLTNRFDLKVFGIKNRICVYKIRRQNIIAVQKSIKEIILKLICTA